MKKEIFVLISGWFSFKEMGATAGDLIARDPVCDWLREADISYEIALVPPFHGGVYWESLDPGRYTHVIFVCGPFGNGWPITEFLPLFPHTRIIGIDLTMPQSLDEWNPFDFLIERDSSRTSHPDLTFGAPPPRVPVVGLILAHKQKEYGSLAWHDEVDAALARLMDKPEMAAVPIDTCLTPNQGGLRTAGEIESLISKMDLVLILFIANQLYDAHLLEAFDRCFTEEAHNQARTCAQKSRQTILLIRLNRFP